MQKDSESNKSQKQNHDKPPKASSTAQCLLQFVYRTVPQIHLLGRTPFYYLIIKMGTWQSLKDAANSIDVCTGIYFY